MKKPLVSVIVPAYQAESFLPQCLDSILGQTYENIEVLVINDGSTDRTAEICDAYARKDSRIRVFHKENGGVSSARNVGLANATGAYVAFCDSDDTLRAAYVEVMLKNALENDCQVSYCGHRTWMDRSAYETEATPPTVPLLLMNSNQAIANVLIGRRIGGSPWCCLVHRSLLEGLFFDPALHLDEDHLLAVQFLTRAKRICSDKTILYNYYSNPAGAVQSAFNPKQLTVMPACDKIRDFLIEAGSYERLKEYMDARYVYCMLLLLRRFKGNKALQKEYGPRLQKIIKKHLNRKSRSHLAKSMQRSSLLVCIHYKLYFFLLDRK